VRVLSDITAAAAAAVAPPVDGKNNNQQQPEDWDMLHVKSSMHSGYGYKCCAPPQITS
jgi:hypothetical protein